MSARAIGALTAVLIMLSPVAPAPAADLVVFRGATVHTAAEPATVVGGQVEIRDSKIVYVGRKRPVAKGTRVLDLEGKHLTPGFVDPFTHLGLIRVALDGATNDSAENTEVLLADIDPLDALDPEVPAFRRARNGGVTTAGVFPASGAPVAGTGIVIKTRAGSPKELVLRRPAGLLFVLGERSRGFRGPKTPPTTRMGTLALLRRELEKAKAYAARKALAAKRKKKAKDRWPGPPANRALEALAAAMAGEHEVWLRAYRQSDVEAALRLARSYKLRPVLVGAAGAAGLAGRLSHDRIPVIFAPVRYQPTRPELEHGSDDAPARMVRAGARLSFTTESALHVQDLPALVAHAVFVGVPQEQALRAGTIEPARVLGVEDRVGSLEVGKDADLVVWDHDPTATFSARPEDVYIEGVRVGGLGPNPR